MRRLTLWILMALLLAACNNVPATVVVLVTSTTDPSVIEVTVTPTLSTNSVTGEATESSNGTANSTQNTPTQAATQAQATTTIAATANPTVANSASDPNRQPIRTDLYIAQEDFEHGYMFWFSGKNGPTIWVLFKNTNDSNTGAWQSYPDSWKTGEPETDPGIVPPDSTHFQPKRGFGKLWRTEPGLRDALGWATTPEYELTTTYIYQPNGSYNDKGEWVSQPGDHLITSLSRKTFVLTEAAEGQVRGTWKILP